MPNNEKIFLEAYEKYADDIFRHCFFRVYDKDLAEDLTQETFIKTWKYFTAGSEIKNIRAFLYKVAVNLIIDHSRKKKAVFLDEQPGEILSKDGEGQMRQYNIEEKIFNKLETGRIIKLLDELPDNQKQVIVMRYIDELLPAEIAQILDETPNAVSVRLNQAMKKLRLIIEAQTKLNENPN